ncbi:MAG: hypothetical protein HYY96_01820, partial [Candidatus Tectomicrobia bacterium]|nr:hypothetical protein [Candidatus Tectomicrobia bacterium]
MKPRTTKSVNPGVVAILLLLFTIVSNGSPASASLVADAGGPYSVLEGGSILLDASGSSADPGDTLTLAWDLDNDGQFDDATGSSVVFQGIDGPSVHPVAVRASTQKTLFWDVENETHQIQKSLFWDFENATSAGSISTSVGAPTGAGISGVASQTGGGPAETFGGGAGKVHLTRFLGPVNYPYIDVTTTSAMRLESISFLHIHNHNPGFPTQFGYQVQLQIDSGSGFSNIGSPLAINAGNSGDTSTINLGSTLIGAGTHRIRWLASGFSSGSNSNTEFFAINDLNLVASVT